MMAFRQRLALAFGGFVLMTLAYVILSDYSQGVTLATRHQTLSTRPTGENITVNVVKSRTHHLKQINTIPATATAQFTKQNKKMSEKSQDVNQTKKTPAKSQDVNLTTKNPVKSHHGNQNKNPTKSQDESQINKNPAKAQTEDQAKNQQSTQNNRRNEEPRAQFLIYVCDVYTYCYGLGDRQRAVASLYVLAILSNRTFGIKWTHPRPLTEFYQPNKVKWNIPNTALLWKSSIEIKFYGPNQMNFDLPFNQQYPQDIVYVRTNNMIINALRKSKYYAPRLPQWARSGLSFFGKVWVDLMTPKDTLRQPLNKVLGEIARDIEIDAKIQRHITKSSVCREMCDSPPDTNATTFTKTQSKQGGNCMTYLQSKVTDIFPPNYNNTLQDFISTDISMFCPHKDRGKYKNNVTIPSLESIQKAKGFDVIDLDLVCVHIRMGKSETLPFDSRRNSEDSIALWWRHMRPYVESGRHVYLATDSYKVRQEGQATFGRRLHSM